MESLIVTALTPVMMAIFILNLSGRKTVRRFAAFSVLTLYAASMGYWLYAGRAPDYRLIVDNREEMWSVEALAMMGGKLQELVKSWHLVVWFAAFAVSWWASRWTWPRRRLWLTGAALAWIALMSARHWNRDPLAGIVRQAVLYHAGLDKALLIEGPPPKLSSALPYKRSGNFGPVMDRYQKAISQEPANRPHVFVIMVESLNANFVGTRSRDGLEFTPFLNSLRNRGLWVEHFYGNTVQTARAQWATLCGVPPVFWAKEFRDFAWVKTRCLPQIIHDQGYRTLFFKGDPRPDYDNTRVFWQSHGFDSVMAMDDSFVTPADKPFQWGWGLQDDATFKKILSWLDADREKQIAAAGKPNPYFTTIATISNHMMFNNLPESQWVIHKHPNSPTEHYENSIRATDGYLRVFFDELAKRPWASNSIVIITGDHSFPTGVHGHNNETGAWEENFRTGFWLVWPGKIAAESVTDIAFSQLDVAPTLMQLLGINEDNHFTGVSLLASKQRSQQHAIPLVQPYDGIWLGAVEWPWKSVRHLTTRQEKLFRLDIDPDESRDLLTMPTLAPDANAALKRLRGERRAIIVNQYVIESGSLWPDK